MSVACIFGAPGTGKTVNSTLVKGKTLLLSSDNSAVVLKHFDRPGLEVVEITSFKHYVETFESVTQSKRYDTIITDCLTDLIDGFIVECRESGSYNDIRQAYMAVYTKVKFLVRKAAHCGTNCVFNCWEDIDELYNEKGEAVQRHSPMLPAKIKQQVLGLCNVIGWVTSAKGKDGEQKWFYITEPSPALMVKDQLGCRKFVMPEDVFNA